MRPMNEPVIEKHLFFNREALRRFESLTQMMLCRGSLECNRRMPLMRFATLFIAICATAPLNAQADLDSYAWDSLADYLTSRFPPASSQYLVQFPSVPIKATWGSTDRSANARRLQEVAGTIPPSGLFWKPGADLVADRYGTLVDALEFPTLPTVTSERKANVVSVYFERLGALQTAVLQMQNKFDLWVRQTKADEPLTSGQLQSWWTMNATRLRPASIAYEAAVRDLDQIIDPSWPVRGAVLSFRLARLQAANNSLNPGGFVFEGSAAALNSVTRAGKAAHDAHECRAIWRYDKGTALRKSSSRSGMLRAKTGPFVRLHAAMSRSEDLLEENGTFISLGFCAEGYVSLRPGPWYSSSLLDLLQGGQLKIEKSSPLSSRELFGDDGWLPRTAVAVIVGYEPRIEARLSKRYAKLVVESWNSGEEISFGPLHLTNDGDNIDRDRVELRSDGSFVIAAPGGQPYVIAIISKRVP